MTAPTGPFLSALAAEARDMRERLDNLADLVSALIRQAPPGQRQDALSGAQEIDVLGQRLDALAVVLDGLSSGQEPARIVRSLTLSDMADRLGSGSTHTRESPGDLQLFD